jgi:hypothetical protein
VFLSCVVGVEFGRRSGPKNSKAPVSGAGAGERQRERSPYVRRSSVRDTFTAETIAAVNALGKAPGTSVEPYGSSR